MSLYSDAKQKTLVQQLWKEACRVRKNAYAPYSNFLVGAATKTKKGIVGGCNVENVSLGGTICAERSLVTRLVADKLLPIQDLCVVTELKGTKNDAASPCGICLQVLSELCSPNLRVWIATPKKIIRMRQLKDLLPGSFKKGAF